MSEKLFKEALEPLLPGGTAHIIAGWMEHYKLRLVLWNHRKTKRGDFRPARFKNERDAISVNKSLNQYNFLITIVHELAHAIVHQTYGRRVKPHGPEWKKEYRNRMRVFLNRRVFPVETEGIIAQHLRNPKASVAAEPELEKALRAYDDKQGNGLVYVDDLRIGDVFRLSNGMIMEKGEKRRTRHFCIEKSTGKIYTVSGLAEVEKL